MSREDAFTPFDPLLASTELTDPWTHALGETPAYAPDYELLGKLLTIPVRAESLSESGRFARGIDAWLASELRRAGFGLDEVWPRAARPRVLPRDLRRRIEQMPAVAPVDASVLGRAYGKQVDVCISRWDRGPELLLSTKAQLSSFAKNLPNRFEEAYGDASNLRGRYPLAATGFFFVQRTTILRDDPATFERTVDMIRKLRDAAGYGGYTATGLALVGWDTAEDAGRVHVNLDKVPVDVAPAQFLAAMIEHVTTVTPVDYHVAVRERRERRAIALPE